jgi:hypothetical protein
MADHRAAKSGKLLGNFFVEFFGEFKRLKKFVENFKLLRLNFVEKTSSNFL